MTQDKIIEIAKQNLFSHMMQEHGITLLGSEITDIVELCKKIIQSQSQTTPSQSEPIYQFYNAVNGQWLDISKDAYSINSLSKKRIVYLAQPIPSQSVDERAVFEKWFLNTYEVKLSSWHGSGYHLSMEDRAFQSWMARANLSNPQPTSQEVLDAEITALKCPDCDDIGWDVQADRNGEAEQCQCEFCYTHPRSIFNLLKAIDTAVKEGK